MDFDPRDRDRDDDMFTERQARFLTHVLVFSGLFLERQYRMFTGLADVQKTHDFLTKLVSTGYATPFVSVRLETPEPT